MTSWHTVTQCVPILTNDVITQCVPILTNDVMTHSNRMLHVFSGISVPVPFVDIFRSQLLSARVSYKTLCRWVNGSRCFEGSWPVIFRGQQSTRSLQLAQHFFETSGTADLRTRRLHQKIWSLELTFCSSNSNGTHKDTCVTTCRICSVELGGVCSGH